MRTRHPFRNLFTYFIVTVTIASWYMFYLYGSISLANIIPTARTFQSRFVGGLPSFKMARCSSSTMSNNGNENQVIIVGSGLAGLSAAHEALKAGARVHMIERAPKPGGNSIKASSGINGAGTRFQRDRGVAKDGTFYEDTVRSAGSRLQAGKLEGIDRDALVRMLTIQSASAVEWLADEIGVDLSVVAQLGGHSTPRTHRGAGSLPPGAAIVSGLLKQLNENPNFTLSTSANAEALLTREKDGTVTGLRYTTTTTTSTDNESGQSQTEEHEVRGPVVFAAGGFAGDAHGMLAKYRPDLAGMPSTNEARSGAHSILSSVGAEFIDMDSVQVHPTGFVDPKNPDLLYKFLAAEALRGEGGILLSGDTGKRFVNEMEKRDVVSDAVMALTPLSAGTQEERDNTTPATTRQWNITLLLDPGTSEATSSHLSFYLWKGLMQKKKIKDLSPEIIDTIDRYAEAVTSGLDMDFGRQSFGHWRLPPGESNREEEVCVGNVTPVVHFTMGGVAFNTKAQVLGRTKEKDGEDMRELEPIDGLWSAGEATGGLHGANRLGGSSLLECVVFGRIAGVEAAKSLGEVKKTG